MFFTPVSAAGNGGLTTTTTTNSLSGGDSTQFMQLLLAQLRNQNPLDPVEDKDFMGQVTAVNSLQELQKMNTALQNLNKSNRLAEGASLLGLTVQAQSADGQPRFGQVTGVTLQGDEVMLWLGQQSVSLADVTSVKI